MSRGGSSMSLGVPTWLQRPQPWVPRWPPASAVHPREGDGRCPHAMVKASRRPSGDGEAATGGRIPHTSSPRTRRPPPTWPEPGAWPGRCVRDAAPTAVHTDACGHRGVCGHSWAAPRQERRLCPGRAVLRGSRHHRGTQSRPGGGEARPSSRKLHGMARRPGAAGR